MKTVLILGYLLTVSCFLAQIFKKKIEEAIVVVMFIDILTLYLLGLVFKDLRVGIIVCLLYGGVAAIWFIIQFLKKKEKFAYVIKDTAATPGLLIFIILFIGIWIINRGRMFSQWDEFSHWGLVVKNMFYFNRFGNYEYSTLLLPGYPPGTALWEYFITKLYGGFMEEYSYRAMGWLIAALIVPFTSHFGWKKIPWAVVSACIVFLIPSIFYVNYPTILYVDELLGIVFAYLLYLLFVSGLTERFFYIAFFSGTVTLCLIKASGSFLVLVAVIIFLIEQFTSEQVKLLRREKMRRVTLQIAYVISIFLVGKFSWSWYLASSGTREAWNTSSINIKNVFNYLQGNGLAYQYAVVDNFFEALLHANLGGHLIHPSLIQWSIICTVSLLCIYFLTMQKKKTIRFSVVIFLGLLVYVAGMLLLYMFTYSEYEAVRLASFSRYLSTYVVGILLFGVMSVAIVCAGEEIHVTYEVASADSMCIYARYTILMMLSLLFCFLPCGNLDRLKASREEIESIRQLRDQYADIRKYQDCLDYKEDIVGVISQQDNGIDGLRLRYELTPIVTMGWSLGPRYYEGDVWTQDITPDEWMDLLIAQGVRRHIVGGANRTLISALLPPRLRSRVGNRKLSAGQPHAVVALFEKQKSCF